MNSIKYLSFQEFRQESKLTQIAERNYLRIDVSRLSCITKINHMVNDLEKLLLIMGYINETLLRGDMGGLQANKASNTSNRCKSPMKFLGSQLHVLYFWSTPIDLKHGSQLETIWHAWRLRKQTSK
jgi:hypothetical protein